MVQYGKRARLGTMLVLTTLFFVAEIVTGYMTNSMALVADSFHMLSDALSIVIGLIAVIYSEKENDRNTYGGTRAEVLGAMANSVFLMALVFTIVVGAIQRLIIVEPITQPLVILGVGAAGLLINLVGLVIFGTHSHGHDDGHTHSHGDTTPRKYSEEFADRQVNHQETNHASRIQEIVTIDDAVNNANNHTKEDTQTTKDSSGQMNMQAVFLHVLGDALGSVVVIISALIIYFVEADWRFYIDPLMSLLISVIISCTTIPLLRRASLILLQNPPQSINVKEVEEKVSKVPGVISVHDFHIWQLTGSCIIATIHVILNDESVFDDVARQLKKIFHESDIHATTIQPEYLSPRKSVSSPVPVDGATESIDRCQNLECTDGCSDCRMRSNAELTTRDPNISLLSSNSGEFPWEEPSDPKTCLLACASNDCNPYMCCNGVGQRKRSKKTKNSYVNPGYVEDPARQNGVNAEAALVARDNKII